MGPNSELVGITCMACMKIFDYVFCLFFHTPFFHLFVPKHSPEGSQKCQKSWKSTNKPPPDLAWKPYLQKAPPKCENRIPFNVLSLFPKVPGIPKSIANWTQDGPRTCNLWANWVPKKTTKNKPLKSHQKQQNNLKLSTPEATKVQPNCNFFVTFCTPGPKWARSRPGVQKRSPEASKEASKRCQKASKRYQKVMKKTSKRLPQGIQMQLASALGIL